MSKKMLFIVNPHSGKGEIRKNLLSVLDSFTKVDYDINIFITQASLDAYKKARDDGEKYDIVVCSGGDGTLNETVTGLMKLEKKPLLGYLPSGTVNDFASGLKIPKNIIKATETIINGIPFPCDIGSFNNRNFTYIAAFGVFTEISYVTPQNYKNALGRVAYFLECLKHLAPFKPFKIKVSYENIVIQDEFVYGMVTNTNTVAGFKSLTPKNAQMNDGLFEVLLIKNPINTLDFQNLANNLLLGIEENNELIYTFNTKELTIESIETIPWTLDGEFGGEHKKAIIQNHHSALNIFTPSSKNPI